METLLKCTLHLSLTEMALRRVVINSWSFFASVWKSQKYLILIGESTDEWRTTAEGKVLEKVKKLGLPNKLVKQVINLVKPIGLEIGRWVHFHYHHLYPSDLYPDSTKLCWTSSGRIDHRKTAENIVHSNICIETRYKLACHYCLEDEIPILWIELSEEKKAYYCSKNSRSHALLFVWPHILSGEFSKLNYLLRNGDRILTSFNQWAFEYSIERGNKTATEYFFQKLTFTEMEDSLMRSAHALFAKFDCVDWSSDVSYYLLTVMTYEQQREMAERHPMAIILLFLFWPLQDLFVENASLVWTFLSPSDYDHLLRNMSANFRESGHYFPNMFQQFFIQSPLGLKKSFVSQSLRFPDFFPARYFLSLFITHGDSESIEVIFKNLEKPDRLKLVNHPKMLRLFYNSILENRWDMIELCLRGASLSEEKMRWKEKFISYVFGYYSRQCERGDPMWKGFFEFFDETDIEGKGQKRKLVELLGECSSK